MSEDMNAEIRRAAGQVSPETLLDAARGRVRGAVERFDASEVGSAERREADAAVDAALDEVRALSAEERAADVATFDGGARAPLPEGPPSMGSLIRAEAAESRSRVHETARDLDHDNQRRTD